MADQTTDLIEKEALAIIALEKEAGDIIASYKAAQEKIDSDWKRVEIAMIKQDIKSIKGEWGTLTIGERLSWDTTDELPAKFYKKVVDAKKLSDTFRLEGKEPKGATPRYTKYLLRRIK